MKKTAKDGILYGEISPEEWAKDTTESYKMLPDLETIYVPHTHFEQCDATQYHNRYINFDIETQKGVVNLTGLFIEIGLPIDEKRNNLDVLFVPESNLFAFEKVLEEYAEDMEIKAMQLGHFINIGTISNVLLIKK